ncbi:hypothetical protein O181_034818 [Austropuccinia psidii MF-1]|uniref:Uncharacterized protein n=1 Tax=Austropuccinia psidii MF-1 TaxID=1389203 RepID=A0A9Q3D698_9BASI|nr:hypothetical protein [Austropuccinia psidii MF-1]
MPVDFYTPEWFNNQDYTIQSLVAKTRSVAFIPIQDLSKNLKLNEDEKIINKAFNKKYWASVTRPYDFYHEVVHSSDDENSNEFSDVDVVEPQNCNNDGNEEDTKSEDSVEIQNKEKSKCTPYFDEEMEDYFQENNEANGKHSLNDGFGPQVWG